jgi:hypothetical protein
MSRVIFICFFFWFAPVYSQEEGVVIPQSIDTVASSPVQSSPLKIANELPQAGTYQIIFKNGTQPHEISEEILFQVNHKRAAQVIVFITIDANTQIKVLPYEMIYASDFVPVPLHIIE